MLELENFDVCKNAATLMIVMLDHLEVNIEVLDIDMETTESDDCREVSRIDRNANGMLAII